MSWLEKVAREIERLEDEVHQIRLERHRYQWPAGHPEAPPEPKQKPRTTADPGS